MIAFLVFWSTLLIVIKGRGDGALRAAAAVVTTPKFAEQTPSGDRAGQASLLCTVDVLHLHVRTVGDPVRWGDCRRRCGERAAASGAIGRGFASGRRRQGRGSMPTPCPVGLSAVSCVGQHHCLPWFIKQTETGAVCNIVSHVWKGLKVSQGLSD